MRVFVGVSGLKSINGNGARPLRALPALLGAGELKKGDNSLIDTDPSFHANA